MIRLVIFDIDGTVIDSVDLHAKAWQEAFAEFGKEVSFASVRRQIGKGADQLLPVFFSQEELARFGDELDRYRSELFKRNYLPQVKPFPKVRDLFLRIKHDGRTIRSSKSANVPKIGSTAV